MPVIPALWEAKVGESPEVRSLRPAWPTWWNPISTKNRKISQVCWRMPVVPATWSLRQENRLNLVGRGCSELKWHHCTQAWATEQKKNVILKIRNTTALLWKIWKTQKGQRNEEESICSSKDIWYITLWYTLFWYFFCPYIIESIPYFKNYVIKIKESLLFLVSILILYR